MAFHNLHTLPTGVEWLNRASLEEAEAAILRCCGSRKFAVAMASARPFLDSEQVVDFAKRVWWQQIAITDWLEAFEAHPRIGDISGLAEKFSTTAGWCEGEQSTALRSGNENTLQELHDMNQRYEAKFGHIFIICASGRSSLEVLTHIKARFHKAPIEELQTAAAEQQKITELRLEKLLGPWKKIEKAEFKPWHNLSQQAGALGPAERRLVLVGGHLQSPSTNCRTLCLPSTGAASDLRPPITTHVLDISLGKPASGIYVKLDMLMETADSPLWRNVGTSITDNDGRSGALMAPSAYLEPGTYRLTFQVQDYHKAQGLTGFYPDVTVTFFVKEWQTAEHFHVPILLSPFSFSTYRGS